MAARLSSNGTATYGEREHPKPVAAVILYTGHTDFTADDPPIFTVTRMSVMVSALALALLRKAESITLSGFGRGIKIEEEICAGFSPKF